MFYNIYELLWHLTMLLGCHPLQCRQAITEVVHRDLKLDPWLPWQKIRRTWTVVMAGCYQKS
jgi:hypothetical protein